MTNFLSHMSPEMKQYIVKSEDFEEIESIGKGGSGCVKKMRHLPTSKICAVKELEFQDEDDMSENDILYYCRECDVLLKCSDNMFVAPFYGCTSTIPLLIVTEFIPNGSLYQTLRKGLPSGERLDGSQKTIIAMGIADAMRMIHEKGAIHRNLKSGNILLDDKLFPRVTDFGLSRFLEEGNSSSFLMTQSVGSPHWMAPEQFESSDYTNKIDVYAYGLLLWEMLTGKTPFDKYKGAQLAIAVCQKNERPHVPSDTPSALKSLIKSCWDRDPDNRPTFDEIFKKISSKKVMFNEAKESAIDYMVGLIKDDKEIREENLNGEKAPPLKYNKYTVNIDIGKAGPAPGGGRRYTKKRTGTVAQHAVFNLISPEQIEKKQQEKVEQEKTEQRKRTIVLSNEIKKVGNVTSPTYIEDYDKCLEKLNEDSSADFFRLTVNILRPDVPPAYFNHVIKDIPLLIQQNDTYFEDFLESGWLNAALPMNTKEDVENTFKILRTISIKSPKSLTKPMIESVTSYIQNNRVNGIRVLCIIQPILSNFEKISNRWIASDHLIRFSNIFLDSCPYEYLNCLNYLMKNSSQFADARRDYVISILNTAIEKKDYNKRNEEFFNDNDNNIYRNIKQTRETSNIFKTEQDIIRQYDSLVYCAIYSMMYDYYTTNCKVPEELLLRHIRNSEIRDACIPYCMIQKTVKFNKQIMKALLGFITDNKEAYYAILCNCDRMQNGETLIEVAGGSWMVNGKMDIKKVANLLLVNYVFAQLRPKIAALDEFPIALTNMLQANDPLLILASSTLVVKSLSIPNFIDRLKTANYFNYYIRVIRPLTDEGSIKSCANLVDSVSRVAYIDFFEYLIDYFARFVQNMNCYTVLTVSALASMCQHKPSAEKVKSYNLTPYIQKLLSDPTCGPYAKALLNKLV